MSERISKAEIRARVWCARHEVNVLSAVPQGDDRTLLVVEYSVTNYMTDRRVWAKMTVLAPLVDTMRAVQDEVELVRDLYDETNR